MDFSKYKLQQYLSEGQVVEKGAQASISTSMNSSMNAKNGSSSATEEQMGNKTRQRNQSSQATGPSQKSNVRYEQSVEYNKNLLKEKEIIKAVESQRSDWRTELQEKVVDGKEREQHPFVTVMPTGDENLIQAVEQMAKAGKKKKVAEQAGDGYIGPPNLNIKNPMASDATRAAGTVKRKADAKARLAAGGKTSGGIANRLQQRADMINSIGEDVEILDVDGNVVADIIDLIKPGPMTGWRQQMAESAWTKKAGKNKEGGLNEKGRKSYEKENPGSDLKRPQPEGGKRKESFCARMSGMRKRQKPENNTGDDRLSLSLKKWNC